MFEQINTKQALTYTKRFSDTAFKAHGLAISGMERAFELQLKAFETNVNKTVEFWSQASEIRDLESAKTLFPKGVAMVKDGAEKAYAISQELVGLSVKTAEAIGELVKGQFDAANESFVKPNGKKASK